MNQIMLGASVPLFVYLVWHWCVPHRHSMRSLLVGPLVVVAGGLWAVVPDFPRLWGDLQLYVEMHHHPHCWIWFNHCRIDLAETDSPFYTLGFIGLGTVLLALAWRMLVKLERQHGA